jgi:hypothetical protein
MSLGFETSALKNPNNCVDPYAPSFWLGKPGALTQIHMPNAGWPRVSSDNFAVRSLLDGQSVDRSPYLCRAWTFSHEWLKPDVMTVFMEYATRQRGIGPFILVDPQMKNLLTPNQASGTDSLHTSEGFTVDVVTSTVTSSTNDSVQGECSLQWTLSLPVTGAANTMHVVPPTGLYGFCLPPTAQSAKNVAFSGYVKLASTTLDNSAQIIPQMVFMNGVGAVQSTLSGVTITAVTGTAGSGWQTFCVTGSVPTGQSGVYLEPRFFAVTGSISAQTAFLFDKLQLEIIDGTTCTTWEYGQGQPLVGVRSDSETVPRILRTSMNFIAVEVT